MKNLKLPPDCVIEAGQQRGEVITLMGVEVHGDSIVDAMRKQLRPLPDDIDRGEVPAKD